MKFDTLSIPALSLIACAFVSPAFAQNTYVNNFGAGGWYSGDTRNDAGVSLVGENYTYGPGGTAADDLAIGSQLGFSSNFAGGASSTYGFGALKIWSGEDNRAKSTLNMINTSGGFAAASALLGSDFYATYRAYNEPSPTSRSVAFRLGIQSTAWSESQDGFAATRTGEESWDLILVYNDSNVAHDWTRHNITATEGTWSLYFQSGNTYFGDARPADKRTLTDWMNDDYFGELLFGDGAVISNVQFGLGADARRNNSYVDFVQSSVLNGGRAIHFVDSSVQISSATPESGPNDFTSSDNAIFQLASGSAADAELTVGNTGTGGEKTILEVNPGADVSIESLDVSSGGVLAGGGKITASEGITITGDGVHAPGFSPGVQVLASDYTNSATLEIELGGTAEATGTDIEPEDGAFDQLLILGELDLSDLTLAINAYDDFAPELGHTFNILYFNDETPVLNDIGLLVNGFGPVVFELNINLDGEGSFLGHAGLNYLQLEVVAVPEPSTVAMAVAGLVGLTLLRRRRK